MYNCYYKGSHQAYYGPWLDHSPCTVTCGGGIKTFIRECNNPPVREGFGDSDCEGDSQQNHVCNEELCPGEDTAEYWP